MDELEIAQLGAQIRLQAAQSPPAASQLAQAQAVALQQQGEIARLRELLREAEPHIHKVDYTLSRNIQEALREP